jgi:hypothetical protein
MCYQKKCSTDKKKIYLDTSVINFLFADDAPEKKKITEKFFENFVANVSCETFISDVVLFEINKTPNERKRQDLISINTIYQFQLLPMNLPEVQSLTLGYIKENIIPERKLEDAQHIAIATFHEMDFLLSWNFKHIARTKIRNNIRALNNKLGYKKQLCLCTPEEFIK